MDNKTPEINPLIEHINQLTNIVMQLEKDMQKIANQSSANNQLLLMLFSAMIHIDPVIKDRFKTIIIPDILSRIDKICTHDALDDFSVQSFLQCSVKSLSTMTENPPQHPYLKLVVSDDSE